MNIIIYIGLLISFFNLPKIVREQLNGNAEGIIGIIIEVLSVAIIFFMIYKYKTMNLNWKIYRTININNFIYSIIKL